MMKVLYRGVNCQLDEENGGQVRAKGDINKLEFMAGNSQIMAGNMLNTIGESSRNAMHGHNICSDTYKTSYVSFTTDLMTAEKFATFGGCVNGYVYVVSVLALDELGIHLSTQEAQMNDHAFEVLVDLVGLEYLPDFVIIGKRSVLV